MDAKKLLGALMTMPGAADGMDGLLPRRRGARPYDDRTSAQSADTRIPEVAKAVAKRERKRQFRLRQKGD